jgi:hypothetical protein
LLRSTISANAAHVEASSGRIVYDTLGSFRQLAIAALPCQAASAAAARRRASSVGLVCMGQ